MKVSKIFESRLQDLLADGYLIVIISNCLDGSFYKLRHRRNGNVITLQQKQDRIIQKSNGIVVYDTLYQH